MFPNDQYSVLTGIDMYRWIHAPSVPTWKAVTITVKCKSQHCEAQKNRSLNRK